MKPLHLGEVIRAKLEETGMSKAEFGRRIGLSRQNIQHLLNRANQDSELLAIISTTLRYDFFLHASKHLQVDNANSGTKTKKSEEAEQRIDALKKEMDQLRKDMQTLLRLIENRNEARKKRQS